MEEWKQVQATVSIDGKSCNYTSIHLHQLFNGHHTFDVSVLCPPLTGQSIWYHERESVIAMQGKSLVIRMQHKGSEDETFFKGIINSIEMDGEEGVSGTLHYRGYSSTVLLESGKTMDSFTDYTLQSIVEEVISTYGNDIKYSCNPFFKRRIPYIQMHEESGYEFLRRLAYQYGEWFYYDGRELVFGNDVRRTEKDETMVYDVDTDILRFGSQILPFRYSRQDYLPSSHNKMYSDDAISEVSGLNTHMQYAIKAGDAVYHSPTTLPNPTALGHPLDIDHFLKVEKGRDVASLTWLSGSSSTCRVRIGAPIVVKIPRNMAERRDLGRYRIMEVTHTIDANGVYRNTFRGIPASMEYIPVENVTLPVARQALATVVDNADPDNQGRVRVQFIWQEEENKATNWIRVRSLDAGSSDALAKNRGFVFIPEKGDQVLVDYELGDTTRPFVSGSMFHGKNGKGGDAGNHIKSISTSSGHTLEFDDDQKGNWGITIKDANGCMFHFDTKGKNIEITAPESMVLSAKNIKLAASENVEVKAEQMLDMVANKDASLNVRNEGTFKFGAGFTVDAGKDITMKTEGGLTATAESDMKIDATDISVNGTGELTAKAQEVLISGKTSTIQGIGFKMEIS